MSGADTTFSDLLARRAVPAVVLLIVLSFALMAGLLVRIAEQQDTQAAAQAESFARAALERRRDVMAKEVKDYASWGEAYHHLHLRTDVDWAYGQQNLGRTLYTDLGYDDVLVVGPTGATTYAVVRGELVPSNQTALAGAGLAALVGTAQSAAAADAKASTGYVVADGMPFLVAAFAITTGGDPTIAVRPGPPSVLVLADALTPTHLAELGDAAFVSKLAAEPASGKAPEPNSFALDSVDGTALITVHWQPEQPGRHLLVLVMPWLVLACAGFSILVFVVLRRTLVTARLLEQNARALAEAHRRAEHMALHDAVTGLPNRLKLQAFLDDRLRRLEPPARVAVLYIDLDRFKKINDRLGHHAGDIVLTETAARLGTAISAQDLVSRVGGDEFVVILTTLETPKQVERLSCWLLKAIPTPIAVEGTLAQVGLSIGIAFADSRTTAEDALRQADMAMYEAKMSGGDAYRFFTVEPHLPLAAHAS